MDDWYPSMGEPVPPGEKGEARRDEAITLYRCPKCKGMAARREFDPGDCPFCKVDREPVEYLPADQAEAQNRALREAVREADREFTRIGSLNYAAKMRAALAQEGER